MGRSLLGDMIDVHLGGEDLLFPHHENEIAQSEALRAARSSAYWLHVKHLKLQDRKMSKSSGNFRTVRELLGDGYDPAAIRWMLLSAHYRSELNFTRSGMSEASGSIRRLLDFRERLRGFPVTAAGPARLCAVASRQLAAFRAAMDDDMNTPRALAALWGLVREGNKAMDSAPRRPCARKLGGGFGGTQDDGRRAGRVRLGGKESRRNSER